MRARVIGLIALVLGAGSPVFAQAAEPATLETVLKELRAIREKQEELEVRITKIQKMLEGKDNTTSTSNSNEHGPNMEALEKIKLPDNPTKDQVRTYVQNIAFASRNQNSWSSDDPQIEMLERVGPANLDVLLESLGSRSRNSNEQFYLLPAIKALVGNEHKEMILKLLPQHHELAEIVLANGWAEDARKTFVDGLRAKPVYLPAEWVEAVASFKDPATYESLKYYFVNGRDSQSTYKAIKDLPNMELTKEVGEMWARFKYRERLWEIVPAACVAAEFGHLDALEKLEDAVENSDPRNSYVTEAREAIERCTEARGSNADIAAWFKQNKGKLVFDAKEKKFVVKNAQ